MKFKSPMGTRLDFVGDAYLALFTRRYIHESYAFLPSNLGIPLYEYLVSNHFLGKMTKFFKVKVPAVLEEHYHEFEVTGKNGATFEYLIGLAALECHDTAYNHYKAILDFFISRNLHTVWEASGQKWHNACLKNPPRK